MYFSKNLKHLRRQQKGLTQEKIANILGLTRSVISSYEDGRAEPNINTLNNIANYFEVSVDNLSNLDLANVDEKEVAYQRSLKKYASSKNLQVQTVEVDSDIPSPVLNMVPQRASAGYTSGFADASYLSNLPTYKLPLLEKGREYRAFEITGESMLPLTPGSIVIGEYMESIADVKEGDVCVVISKDQGIVLKKIHRQGASPGHLLLKSSNPNYRPYELEEDEVLELWRFRAHISRDFPEVMDDIEYLKQAYYRLESDFQELKVKLSGEEV